MQCPAENIFSDKGFNELAQEYAKVSINKDLKFNRINQDWYLEEETKGNLLAISVKVNNKLVGFASLYISNYPHYNAKIGTIETIFIKKEYRKHNLGNLLYSKLEEIAIQNKLAGLYQGAPYNSKLAKALMRKWQPTNVLFWKPLICMN